MPPRASQLTESKSSCWIVSPAAHNSQLASAFSRNIAIHFAGRQQQLEQLPRYLTLVYKPDYASMTPTEIHCEVEEILCVMPDLLTRHTQRDSLTVRETVSGKLYCSCRMPANDLDDDDMAGCDTHNCPHGQWFHFTCVGVKRVPKGSFFFRCVGRQNNHMHD